MMQTKNIAIINTLSSLLLTVLTMISGFIIPRIILHTFGSEINGLVSTLQQYLNYISLIEGGLGGVVMASLYKPLLDKDIEKISKITKTISSFYKKIAIVFVGYALLLALLYPHIVKTSLEYYYIFWLTIILSISMFVQYFFAITYKLILNANKQVYITSLVQGVCIILNTVLFIVCIRVYPSIHAIKGITALVYILQPILYCRFVKKQFQIDKNSESDITLIKERWNGFGINIAAFVHGNTAAIVLSLIIGLKSVSVYSIYFLIVNAIRSVIISISGGLQPSIGGLVAKGDRDYLTKRYNTYEFILTYVSFVLFSCCCVLIVPFIMIYTNGITDISYKEPLFGFLLCMAELCYCLREPSSILIYSANKFKEVSKYAYLEAILNIVISIALVFKFGIVGVAIGSLVSILCRHILQLVFLSNNILLRSLNYYLRLICVFVLGIVIVLSISLFYVYRIKVDYLNWLLWAIVSFVISLSVFSLLSWLFFREELRSIEDHLHIKKRIFKR